MNTIIITFWFLSHLFGYRYVRKPIKDFKTQMIAL